VELDLKKYKNHNRKFPWKLIVRIITALISIAMIWYVSQVLKERQMENQQKENAELEIEVETAS